MSAPKQFEVETALGKLLALEHQDPSYPGLTLFWGNQQVAVLEYNSTDDPPAIKIHVWRDGQEDPTVSYVVQKISEEEKC